MQESKIVICNNCKEKIIVNSDKKVLMCPYCGSSDLTYLQDPEQDNVRYLFGVKVDTQQINDKLLWIMFGIIVIGLFVLLFSFKK